jgi:hypothetical protein
MSSAEESDPIQQSLRVGRLKTLERLGLARERRGRVAARCRPGQVPSHAKGCHDSAVREASGSVQECGREIAIAAALQVDHVIHVSTGVAVHEQPGTGGARLLALLGIARGGLSHRPGVAAPALAPADRTQLSRNPS